MGCGAESSACALHCIAAMAQQQSACIPVTYGSIYTANWRLTRLLVHMLSQNGVNSQAGFARARRAHQQLRLAPPQRCQCINSL